ncbi:MAG: hypothetical protein JKY53_04825 [Flavobacteriales bacterium]|nr:hypothetical protein [Flavobacteriales bacterium]
MKKHWVTYVFKQFERIYGFTDWGKVSYGASDSAMVIVAKTESNFFGTQTPFPDDFISQEWLSEEIPFLFDSEQQYPIIEVKNNQVVVNLDIVAPAFYFLSGWQEYNSPHRDSIGRFPYEASIQKKLDIIDLPVVNYYFDILKTAIEKAFEIELKVDLWEGKETGVFLSHDIDKINSGWLEGGFNELKKGKPLSAFRVASQRGIGKDVWFNFDDITELEKRYQATSTFFFLPEKGKYKGVNNADYSISEIKVIDSIINLNKNNYSIGLHGSYGSSFESGKLRNELQNVPVKTTTNRFHFLSWEQRLTPSILDNSEIEKDCSLGFSEHYGYRNGMCHPFNLFDLKHDKMVKVIEYPLHLMDTTFQQKKYLNIDKLEIPKVFEKLHSEAKKFNGFTSVLWHNNFFSKYKYEGWSAVYESILASIDKKSTAFISLGSAKR